MLRNDGGKFTNVSLAAGLRPVPTHTNGAAWCDYDGDGLLDLYMSNEWGPVRVYMNRKGTLEESTEAAGLAAATGFWNSIALGDLDGDGYTDAVLAQNFLTPQQETVPYDGGLSLLLRGGPVKEGESFGLTEVWPLESGIVVPGDAKSLALVDFTGSGRPDLFFGMNNDAPAVFLHNGARNDGSPLTLALRGKPGNPGAVGARVTVEVPGLPLQTAERAAGSGYLTQNGPDLHFGWGLAGSDAASAKVTVRWPDGESTSHTLTREEGPRYLIEAQP
jgi:hypothetical protein